MSKQPEASAAKSPSKKKEEPTEEDVLRFIPKSRQAERRAKLARQLGRLFELFEKADAPGTCDTREVGTLLRGMGLNPSEAVVLRVIELVEEPTTTGRVRLDRLQPIILDILTSYQFEGKLMVRENEEMLMRAFQAIDREGRGYIEAETMRSLLTSAGERFGPEEALEMVSAAADPETGRIYYEEYAALLSEN
jgi:Ca2+-binding EF-hand superfamily protein